MKRILFLVLCVIGLEAYAANFTSSTAPTATMQPMSNAYMKTGSTYTPTVYAVGSYSPSAAPAGGPHKAAPGKDDGSYNPNNPQFSPIGDAIIPLFIMSFFYTLMVVYKRKKS